MRILFKAKVILGMIGVLLSLAVTLRGLAQANDNPWAPPTNLSASGAAAQPALAVAADGTLHALWWDTLDGEQYATTTDETGTTWTPPRGVPQVVGDRQVNEQTGEITLTAPKEVQMIAGTRGGVYAVWRNVDDQLLAAQVQRAGWSAETTLDEAATTLGLSADVSGTVHLAYVRPLSSRAFPAGVYYQATKGVGWSGPSLVSASPYFRAAKPADVPVSVAGNGQGQTIVAWDDPYLGQSFYASSGDGGATWSAPQAVSGAQDGRVTQAQAAAAANSDFLLVWQDPAAGGCGLTQRQSHDGGQTWSAPLRVLSGLNRCTGRWSFSQGGDGRLWLTITPLSDNQGQDVGVVTLAAWDGLRWSEPVEASVNFFDEAAQRNTSLGCLGAAIGGQVAGLLGCDDRGDVWATRSRVELDTLIPALQPVWQAPETLSGQDSDRSSSAGIPALAADGQGRFYALWSEAPAADEPGLALAAAAWDGSRWSRAAQVLRSPAAPQDFGASVQAISKAEQPALAVDNQARLHAVWSGGTDGEIYYSQAYARDATSPQGWAEPAALPGPTTSGSWPDILADPRGDVLYTAYAVPYNERRGIYVVRSIDGGATWLTPTLAFDAVRANWNSVDKPRLALDAAAGVLHAVWLQANLPGSTGAQAIYTARSTDNGQSWSQAQKVAEGAIDWPRIAVAGKDQIYVAWLQTRGLNRAAGTPEVWGQYSPDGGERWTDPEAVRGLQVSGPIGLTSDGAGRLYLAGLGAASSGESVLQFTAWNGQAWGEVESFGLGQPAAPGNAAAAAAGAPGVIAALRLWTWQTDGSGQFQAAATGREVEAPLALQPLPTFTPLPVSTIQATPAPTPIATPQARPQAVDPPRALSSGLLQNLQPLMMGGIFAGVIVMAVVGWAMWKKRK